ncbi:hypothetical protein GII33_01695 [Gordonia pseudamarae]|jgi:hypothetical protein|uniref:Low molecular weight antigen MTB12-like C-terminal domain-containing protein n=1 Tax=Gordonia pseudamarae TaxID=2831662 RepID=A0ABX6ID40_9ACTN|nr:MULTISPECIES: hypothetical protein [Gordonia]MBD0022010.1 hypothetical protein [Gordonia sp. (in: high G+C Gram-positive bacteria)]QHN24871.1 hypothetical protein GII33_01695 [Gordonia pseudamarae]QHN33804.1 hypothetical protein GII31_01690 [Gordonia pseudamarae]
MNTHPAITTSTAAVAILTATAATALVGTTGVASAAPTVRTPSGTLPADYRVTSATPSLTDLGNIVTFLVATNASDKAKAANVEGGMNAVVVPKTVYRLGLFRPPLGWHNLTGPLRQQGNSATATLNSGSSGRPTIRMTIEFKKLDGNWKLSATSLCSGVKAVGLNIYCNR